MPFPTDQVEELKLMAVSVSMCDEGGVSFFLLTGVKLPDGCVPTSIDLLLCPTPRDGYNSRLFFAQQVQPPVKPGRDPLNWNVNGVRIAERTWHAFSWRTSPSSLRLAQMVAIHLKALQ